MTISVAATPFGLPAIDLLGAQFTDLKAGDPLAPVTVVVRSNLVSVSVRRALAARPGGIANVTFITLRRLAEQLAAPQLASIGRRPVSAPLISNAVRAILDDAPGVFAPVAQHPTTEEALADSYRELRAIPDGALDDVSRCSARAADVVRIHRAVRQQLSQDWYDEEDLLAVASVGVAAPGAPILIHLLPELSANETAFVHALAVATEVRINVGLTGDVDVDEATVSAYLRAELRVPPRPVASPSASAILSVSDPDDEVRSVVRIVEGWMRDGTRLGSTAVLYPTADPYARLLRQHLAAAGIPVNGTPVRSIGDMVFGNVIRSFLSLSDRDFRRQDVLELFTGGALLDGGRHVPSRAWERVSRAAGIARGVDWSQRLPRWVARQREQADKYDVEGQTARAAGCRKDADHGENLATFISRLRADLCPDQAPQTWNEHGDWLRSLAATYLGDESRRYSWPDDDWQAAQRVEEVLDRLAALDAVDGPSCSPAVFRRALDSELDVALRKTGRPGEGVMVGPIAVAAGMVFDRIVVMGMAEGRFPARRLEDSLLPDAERAASGGHLRLSTQRIHDDHRHFLAAVAGARETTLTYPRGDLRRSTHQAPSRWLLTSAAHLAGVEHMTSSDLGRYARAPWFIVVSSYAGGLARAKLNASEHELRLTAIARNALQHSVVAADDRMHRALEVVRARRNHRFTRFDGNLSSVDAGLILPVRISATSLENWAKCPRSYLFTHVLRVEPIEEPERRYEMDPLTKGSLMHAILEQFVGDAITQGHDLESWTAADGDRLKLIADSHFDAAERDGDTGRALLWRAERVRLEKQLEVFLSKDSNRLMSGFRPEAAEQPFEDVPIDLSNGRVLHMRGFIDRVDISGDGSVAVIDYKTGSAAAYGTLSEDDPHQKGQRLQPFVYSRAVRASHPEAPSISAHYWFTKDDKLIGYAITDAIESEVLAAMDRIVGGIAGGVFPARPADTPAFGWVDCWACTPDGLSDADARREWQRIRRDPALSGYLALVDPEAHDERS